MVAQRWAGIGGQVAIANGYRVISQIPVYVLSGGRNSRFGSDKARALFQGEPLLVHVTRTLEPYAQWLTVVAEVSDKYRDFGIRTIADRFAGIGPLGGLHRALEDLPAKGWLLLTCCDLLGVQPDWIETLLSHRFFGGSVIAFKGERWEPLLALYHSRAKKQIEEAIISGRPALWRIIEQVDSLPVPLPQDFHKAVQINTTEALEAYSRRQKLLDKK